MSYIDTHAHLYLCKPPLAELVQKAKTAEVSGILNVGLNVETSLQAWQMAQEYPQFLFPTAGIHPCETPKNPDLSALKTVVETHTFHAIGEIGLDFYRDNGPEEDQIRLFRAQLDLAAEKNLSAIIHNRHSDLQMIQVLKAYPQVRKVVHCFSADQTFIDQTIGDGTTFYSFTGLITTSDRDSYFDAIRSIPLNRIMIETDCPYLTPKPFKPTENQPAFVPEVAVKLADILGQTIDVIAKATTQNAKHFFNLP
ncbi:MAG: TatD family hydrolase [Candidatus Margulisiibacteriota bacterium]